MSGDARGSAIIGLRPDDRATYRLIVGEPSDPGSFRGAAENSEISSHRQQS
jgi:hypothetical protein